ncbi:MAG: signal peptidase II [Candidatus Omnitrophota bacterium]|nr:MAG: signal peptidase II [Candidatus Omnitrophota bacterium]
MWGVAALVFFCDLLVKGYLRHNLAFQSIPVIKNIFHITVVFNTGAAFGVLQGKTTFIIYITVLFILWLFIFLRKEKQIKPKFAIPYGLIFGGALSNLYDRLLLGYVVDYIDLRVWPVFNLSDTCITIGIGLLLIYSFRPQKQS